MVKSNSVIKFYALPGIFVSFFIFFLVLLIFIFLFTKINVDNFFYILNFSDFINILRFSFLQSILSTLFSTILSVLISISLNRRIFFAKKLLIDICNLTLALPVLVAIVGIINIWGKEGYISKIFELIGIKYNISIYGFFGIILTHIFFNVPLGINIFLKQLKMIPKEQFYIANNLNIKGWRKFILIEWQFLKKKIKSTAILIFMLCFSSLTVITTLGGGPKNTNIEAAIFYAFSYEYNPVKAIMLSIFKMFFYFGLMILTKNSNKNIFIADNIKNFQLNKQKNTIFTKIIDVILITALVLLIIPPIISIIINGLQEDIKCITMDYNIWIAIINSLKISFISGILSTLLSILLILSIKEFLSKKYTKISRLIELFSILIFAMPNVTFATGLFLILKETNISDNIYYLLIITNAFITIPFTIKILDQAFLNVGKYYDKLCLSLNINGWTKFKIIELKALKKYLVQSFFMAFILSIGETNIISLFGNQTFYTLPFYLYQQIEFYQSNKSGFTALLILMICFFTLKITEKIIKKI